MLLWTAQDVSSWEVKNIKHTFILFSKNKMSWFYAHTQIHTHRHTHTHTHTHIYIKHMGLTSFFKTNCFVTNWLIFSFILTVGAEDFKAFWITFLEDKFYFFFLLHELVTTCKITTWYKFFMRKGQNT